MSACIAGGARGRPARARRGGGHDGAPPRVDGDSISLFTTTSRKATGTVAPRRAERTEETALLGCDLTLIGQLNRFDSMNSIVNRVSINEHVSALEAKNRMNNDWQKANSIKCMIQSSDRTHPESDELHRLFGHRDVVRRLRVLRLRERARASRPAVTL